jgi:uncharacterized membrane protein
MNKLKYKSESPQVGKSAQMLSVIRSSGLSNFFFRTETDRGLTLSMMFSVVLVLVRIYFSGHLGFLFLVWNLFLAWLPFAMTNRAQYSQKWKQGKRLLILFLAWLLFIPNAFYIITDLFHLGYHEGAPLWFDLVLILSFAWNGLLLGLLSVRQLEKMMQPYLRGKHELLFIFPIMCLNAWGIYIGRYLRFNSWDVITNPFALIADIADMLFHPLQYKIAWSMIACFSVFMTLMYVAVKKIAKVIH